MRSLTVALSAGVALLAIVGAACGRSAPAAEEMDMGMATEVTLTAEQIAHGGVKWTAVSAQSVADSFEAPGHLVPDEDHTARLSVSVRGRVTAVNANVGDMVARGQVLVVLQSSVVETSRPRKSRGRAVRAAIHTPVCTPGS